MENILDKVKNRVDAAEVSYVESHKTEIEFKGWKLKESSVAQTEGYSLRVIKNGRIGFSATTDPNGIDDMVENAVATAEFGEQVDITFPGKREFVVPDIYDEKLEKLTIPEIIEFGRKFIGKCESFRGIADLDFSSERILTERKIINTSGFEGGYRKSYLTWGGSLNRVKENDVFLIWDGSAATYLPDMDEEITKMTGPFAEKIELAENVIDISTGKMPVVFHPRGVMIVLLPLNAAINGRTVYTGTTPLVDKEGKKLFDENFTVVDDGTLDRRIGSSPFDTEGIPKRRIPIVENGVFKNFLFDLVTAAKANRESNGAATRSIFGSPFPSSSNIAIRAGNTPKDDIIGSVENGILVESVLGLGQGNIISGTFSNPFGTVFKIENGRLVGRVKDGTIAGNIYEDLKEITAISDKQELVWGSYLAPYMRVDTLTVTGK
ncbi:hypothetical protein DRQ36_06170 [bacterium]|nr:MAG: hypothetical protein DRQ36_06170 [bacterium]